MELKLTSSQKSLPTLSEWMTKNSKRAVNNTDSQATSVVKVPKFCLPTCMDGHVDLPPSILPPNPSTWKKSEIAEWG